MLDFEECEFSGHLRANGSKGEYWIMDEVEVYVERMTPVPHGIVTERIGGEFDTIDDAKAFAELEDG